MDQRNLTLRPIIETDKSIRVSTPKKQPNPYFYRTIMQDMWDEWPDDNAVLVGKAGTNLGVRSYSLSDDFYYGYTAGDRFSRVHADNIGTETGIESGPTFEGRIGNVACRTDYKNEVPKYLVEANDKLWFFEGDFATGTPTEVLNFSDYGGATTGWANNYDFDGYGLVLVGQYRGDKSGEPWRVFMSEDFGATWTIAFNIRDIGRGSTPPNEHLHSVRYDPYHDWIWVQSGDGVGRDTFVSNDRGKKWYSLGTIPLMTEIMVFPDHIVIGSDTSDIHGLVFIEKGMVYTLPFEGVGLRPDMLEWQSLHANFQNTSFFTTSNQHGMQRIGKGQMETFVGHTVADGTQAGLIATCDGYNWREIWRVPITGNGGNGIRHVIGPDKNGLCIGTLSGHSKGQFVFKKPTWE